MSLSTQVVVIGAGPGGYAAAFYAADRGLRVTLIDPAVNPGGVCLYRGCIPSKALLHVAGVVNEAKHAEAWGVSFGAPSIDVDRLRAFKSKVVDRLTGGLGQLSKQRKITYVQGRAAFRDARTLEITRDGEKQAETLTFEHAIVATGSRPTTIPGLSVDSPRVMDSTAALELPDVPASLLVVGGGYIGLELGSVYAALGTRVTVVEMTGGLLPGADRDLVNVLAKRIERITDAVLLDTKVVGIKEVKGGIAVTLEPSTGSGQPSTGSGQPSTGSGQGGGEPKERTFERVLVAIGRRPNGDVPGLDRTAVKMTPRGFIEVDGSRRTAEPSIYAIGDVAGEPMLAHKASHEARVAVDAIAGRKTAFEPLAIPAVVFTDPELAWCGLTENDAQQQKREVAVTRFPWAASGRAITIDRTDGLTKLVLDPTSGRVLGVGIVGRGAGEMIAEGVLAVEMGASAEDVSLSIHAHPTLSETFMEAADVFFGHATHIYRPRRDSR
ncbi:MAG: dihydrolipoyl dehydrogenase [Acidobacteria bacterium RIFCSPLOWO2_02_FULL_67_36]|nr:MAG: dihydrolipoyl dehydrogenase [Acidobacteria bacterium RIFCSPLOWO2_02_FULL_67_36]OFW21309.1 MAG: dihydrolipoyl dehydrogenase [Acidobacteria bacterium RIFCSPLOWO2_12_FULL_66_21]